MSGGQCFSVLPDRMPAPAQEEMSEAQKKVVADLTATRGELRGPFTAIIHSPKLADRLQHLGALEEMFDCFDWRKFLSAIEARKVGSGFPGDVCGHEGHASLSDYTATTLSLRTAERERAWLR